MSHLSQDNLDRLSLTWSMGISNPRSKKFPSAPGQPWAFQVVPDMVCGHHQSQVQDVPICPRTTLDISGCPRNGLWASQIPGTRCPLLDIPCRLPNMVNGHHASPVTEVLGEDDATAAHCATWTDIVFDPLACPKIFLQVRQ